MLRLKLTHVSKSSHRAPMGFFDVGDVWANSKMWFALTKHLFSRDVALNAFSIDPELVVDSPISRTLYTGSNDLCILCHVILLTIRYQSSQHDGSWWRHQMETFSALLAICAGNSPVTGEFPTQRPVTRSFDVFFDLRLNKRLGKQL